MTTDPSVGPRETDTVSGIGDPDGRHALVCTERSPPANEGRCVDVRPGATAGYAGGPVRLPLIVRGAGRRIQMPWTERAELDTRVTTMLASAAADWVRFGDPSTIGRLIGPRNAAALEHRLADTASAAGVPLVTWTRTRPDDVDRADYDIVVERATLGA